MNARQIESDVDLRLKKRQLEAKIGRLLRTWEPRLGVHVGSWNIRDMKSYWASANERTREITFNFRLVEMPPALLRCVVVHELVHFLTDGHDRKFYELMDKHLPGWRKIDEKYAGPMTKHS